MKHFQISQIFSHRLFAKEVFLCNLVALLCLFATQNLQGQEDWPCETEDPVIFSGEGGVTFCMLYGNLTFDYQIGVGSPLNVTTSQEFTQIYGAVPLGAKILVVGDFIVNSPSWELEGAFVKVAIGKQITTLGNVVFTLDNTKIFACTGFWKGIRLGSNGTIVTMNGTQIEDAENAIASSASNTILSITATTFNRNKVGILLGRKNELTLNPPLITEFDGNSFVCTSGLNGSLPGAPQITEAGIISNNVPMSLFGDNLFEKIHSGIIMTGTVSSLTGFGFDFLKMYRDGIYAENANITISTSTFKNCARKGIFCKRVVYVDVTNSDFLYDSGLDQKFSGTYLYTCGVYAEGFMLNSHLKVYSGNTFDVQFGSAKSVSAILINGFGTGSAFSSGFDIYINDNIFTFGNSKNSQGVALFSGNYPENSKVEISDNTFNTLVTMPSLGGDVMINVVAGQKHSLKIRNNIFGGQKISGFSNRGIQLQACTGFNRYVVDNKFVAPPFIPTYEAGVYAGFFDNTIICSNKDVKGCSIGFCFVGPFENLDFLENEVILHRLLLITAGSYIDETQHGGNQQSPYYSNGIAYNDATQAECTDNADLSRFIVHENQSTGYYSPNWRPYHPKDIIPDMSDEWWRKESGNPSNDCLSNIPPGLADLLTPLKINTASGTLASIVENPVLVHFAEEGLYELLRLTPQFASASPMFQSFLAAKQNTNLRRFYEIGRALEAARIASSNLNNSAESAHQSIFNLHQTLSQLDYTLANSANPTELANATSSKLSAVNQMIAALQSLQNSEAAYISEVQSNIPAIQQQIAAIVVSGEVEQNIKSAFDYYAKSLTSHVFSEIEREAIFEIASECPQDGGPGVIMARGLVDKCDFEALQNLTASCDPPITEVPIISAPAPRPSNKKIAEKMVQSRLVADEIVLHLSNEGLSEVSLLDGLGNVIYTNSSASDTLIIPAQNLTSGIYYLVIQHSSGENETIKIIKVNR